MTFKEGRAAAVASAIALAVLPDTAFADIVRGPIPASNPFSAQSAADLALLIFLIIAAAAVATVLIVRHRK